MMPGEILRAARARHGLSQERLARRAGTTQSAISRLERDEISPTVQTLAELLHLVGEDLELSAREADHGHDRAMLRRNLSRTASERVNRATEQANFVLRNRGAARR